MGKNAIRQKRVIEIKPAAKGTQLVSGVFIANKASESSLLRVKDPPAEAPVVTIGSRRGKSAMTAVRRLATSRALGLAGFDELADELSLPPEMMADTSEFYFPGERRRFESSPRDRLARAIVATRDRVASLGLVGGTRLISREIVLEIPGSEFTAATGHNRIRVTVSIDANFVEQIQSNQPDELAAIDDLSKQYLSAGIEQSKDTDSVTITEGKLLMARMEFV